MVGYLSGLILTAAISLWIRSGFPVYAIGNATHDDLLYVVMARYLSVGQWLGPYDQMTLAKGMFYPMFIAAAHFAGIPLKIAEQLVYLVVSAMAAEFVRRKTGKAYFAAGLFALLAFSPVVWNHALNRVIREGLYLSLSFAVVILLTLVAFPGQKKGTWSVLFRSLLAIALGLIGAAYWLTREEGLWLVPTFGVVLLLAALGVFRVEENRLLQPAAGTAPRRWSFELRRLLSFAWPLALALAVFAAADLLAANLNYEHYGTFETCDFREKNFVRAYAALARVHQDHWQPYVLFPKDARERVYAVSPAARELQPYFEGALGEGWRRNGCNEMKIEPCREVLTGWFSWELRDTVEALGHYRSASEAVQFYKALADQIDSACADGRLECLPRRASLLPPFRREYVEPSVHSAEEAGRILLTLKEGPILTPPSAGDPRQIALFSEMVGNVGTDEGTLPLPRTLEGWVGARTGTPSIRVVSKGPDEFPSSVTALDPGELASQYPNLKIFRFRLETSCPAESCALRVEAPGISPALVALDQMSHPVTLQSPELLLRIEKTTVSETEAQKPSSPQSRIAIVVSWIYVFGLPLSSVLAVLGVGFAAVRERLHEVPLEIFTLGAASLTAVSTRIAMIAYLTATSANLTHLLHLSPASCFILLFAAVGNYCGWVAFRRQNPRSQAVGGFVPPHSKPAVAGKSVGFLHK